MEKTPSMSGVEAHKTRGLSMSDDHELITDTGVILTDKIDHRKYKLQSIAVSNCFEKHSEHLKRHFRILDCGSRLEFAIGPNGEMRLVRADFCKDRMCTACQRRRSLKIFHDVLAIVSKMRSERPNTEFLLLTLTIPNVPGEQLSEALTFMLKGWTRLMQRKEVKAPVLGWFRSLEITYNEQRDDYHPHIHALLAVSNQYFKGKKYIKHCRWLELWQEAMRDDSITEVDIRKIRPNPKRKDSSALESSAAEVAKYATKPSDYLTKHVTDDKHDYYYSANKDVVLMLAEAIKGRRLQQVGGEFKRIKAELELEDVDSDDVDLVHVNKDDPLVEVIRHELYRWDPSLKNYIN